MARTASMAAWLGDGSILYGRHGDHADFASGEEEDRTVFEPFAQCGAI
jgi:hypothetical protein